MFVSNAFSREAFIMDGVKESLKLKISQLSEHITVLKQECKNVSAFLIDKLELEKILYNASLEDFNIDPEVYLDLE